MTDLDLRLIFSSEPDLAHAMVALMGELPGRVMEVDWRDAKDGLPRFYLDFGRRRVYTIPLPEGGGIPLTSREMAQKLLDAIHLQMAAGHSLDNLLAKYRPRSAVNRIDRRANQWLRKLEEQAASGERSPGYIRLVRGYLRGPFSYLANRTVTELSYGVLEDWNLWMASELGLSPKTRRNVLGALRALLGWLQERKELRDVPKFPTVARVEYAPTIISPKTQQAILDEIPYERRGIFLAMARTGIRPGSARALDVSDWRDGWLMVSKAAKGGNATAEIRGTKTGKIHRLPIREIAPDLEEWLVIHTHPADRDSGKTPLFLNPYAHNRERRWLLSALERNWATACKVVGVKVSLYEGTKHSLGTALIADGVDERIVQKLFGHADIRSTRMYTVLSDQGMIDALRGRGDS